MKDWKAIAAKLDGFLLAALGGIATAYPDQHWPTIAIMAIGVLGSVLGVAGSTPVGSGAKP